MITGKMGAGKGFAAARFTHRYGATRWTRSELMKRLAHSFVDRTDLPDEILLRIFPDRQDRDQVREALLDYADNYQPEPGKPRLLYQQVTAICQDFQPLCFEEELEARIASTESDFNLIDDVRSLPAFEYFSDLGYRSLRIEASAEARTQRILARDGYLPATASLQHPSESALDQVDHHFVVVNNGDDLNSFYHQLDNVYQELANADIQLEKL
jgi:dephospho-CoA kinase